MTIRTDEKWHIQSVKCSVLLTSLWPRQSSKQNFLTLMPVLYLYHLAPPVTYTVLHGSRPSKWQTLEDLTMQSIIKISEVAKSFLLSSLFFLRILVMSTSDMSKTGYYPEPPWKLAVYCWQCFHALKPRYLRNPGLKCKKKILQQQYAVSRCKAHCLSCHICSLLPW